MSVRLVSSNKSPAPRIPRASYTPQHFQPGHEGESMRNRLAIAALLVAVLGLFVLGFWLDTPPGVLP